MAALSRYTTEVPVSRTLAAIQDNLRAAGADTVMVEYDQNKQPTAVSFSIQTKLGPMSFRMSVDVERIRVVLRNQWLKSVAPKSVTNDGQAARVGWRILHGWLEEQLAMIQIEMATLEQIMLPYAVNAQGQTVYQILTEPGRMTRLLSATVADSPEPAP